GWNGELERRTAQAEGNAADAGQRAGVGCRVAQRGRIPLPGCRGNGGRSLRGPLRADDHDADLIASRLDSSRAVAQRQPHRAGNGPASRVGVADPRLSLRRANPATGWIRFPASKNHKVIHGWSRQHHAATSKIRLVSKPPKPRVRLSPNRAWHAVA